MELDETLFAQQQVIRLHALLEASRLIHSTIELDKVLVTVLKIVVRELEATGAFFTTFPHFYGEVPADFNDPKIREANDATGDSAKNRWVRFPLSDKAGQPFSELVAILPADRTLTLDEMDFLSSLAIQAAAAIENARFHERALEWRRVEADLAAARDIQRSLLPQQMPEISGYSIAAHSVTCYEVGGDYFDIVPLPSGDTVIVVADVAGKGLSSALVGTSFRSAFRAMASSETTLVDLATRMNLLHYNEGPEARRRYVTTFLTRLSPATNALEVVNAGHNPAFLVSATGDVRHIEASDRPVGIFPLSNYTSEKFLLDKGARLLIYTDGLTEACRGDEEFGGERLLQAFRNCNSVTAESILESLWATLRDFSDEPRLSDDMTALVLLRQR
ncbi:serine phosphatase RsbU (regulator of sigma subunit) [Edaphobacter aggregans]|uniref:Serine phosphatase RsbU (Regulator of sigma subunit) n=1 Tax=Edaphobacter aggregans TaxID=570835 RepID=A0A428MP23_9BACT|nr:PP2C family protein-serine/threonine phosphatase [Edaphobacter aggregans]RSL18678.1 serine phosphatase RsbU (regulator of sigma subunit) [Edaphobacter aggregans]